jgi:hypothetical protein
MHLFHGCYELIHGPMQRLPLDGRVAAPRIPILPRSDVGHCGTNNALSGSFARRRRILGTEYTAITPGNVRRFIP